MNLPTLPVTGKGSQTGRGLLRRSGTVPPLPWSTFCTAAYKPGARHQAGLARWASAFPYVNGGLFSKSTDVPRFSRIARSYLLHIGNLDWKKINPDIFGSMIQAIADEDERGALGMHYTSVPNILRVLNPLFLDDLRAKLEEDGSNAPEAAQPAHNRMARIRVFDPACGSGNFPGHRLQGNARHRSRNQPGERRAGAQVRHPPDETSGASRFAIFPPKSLDSRSSSRSTSATCSTAGNGKHWQSSFPSMP